jgi:hypothetical protein
MFPANLTVCNIILDIEKNSRISNMYVVRLLTVTKKGTE